MRIKQIILAAAAALCILLIPLSARAEGITLDGEFSDWSDKPYLQDPTGDETPSNDITTVKWYPDQASSNLYLYFERLNVDDGDKGKKFEDWNMETYLTGDGTTTRAEIKYHPPSNKVEVVLYDESGNYLWSEKLKWGDDKDPGQRIEIGIPLQYVTSSVTSGYQVDLYCVSGSDTMPDNGSIVISTVSTFPMQSLAGVIIITIISLITVVYKRKTLIRRS